MGDYSERLTLSAAKCELVRVALGGFLTPRWVIAYHIVRGKLGDSRTAVAISGASTGREVSAAMLAALAEVESALTPTL